MNPQRIAGRNPRYEEKGFTLEYDPVERSLSTMVFVPRKLWAVRVTVNNKPAAFDPKLLSVRH